MSQITEIIHESEDFAAHLVEHDNPGPHEPTHTVVVTKLPRVSLNGLLPRVLSRLAGEIAATQGLQAPESDQEDAAVIAARDAHEARS